MNDFTVAFKKEQFSVSVPSSATILDLRQILAERTGVALSGMKLMGVKGADTVTLAELKLKNPTKLMLVGTPSVEKDMIQAGDQLIAEQRLRDAIEEAARQEAERERQQREAEQRAAEAAARAEREAQRRTEAEEYERRRRAAEAESIAAAEAPDFDAVITAQLECRSATLVGADEIQTGNSVVLPPSLLGEVQQRRVPFPLFFELECVAGDGETHRCCCGVRSFTAEEGKVYVPPMIMERLHAGEDSFVALRTARPPRGEFLQLQPVSASWLEINADNRRPLLEDQLRRRYQLVSVDDVIEVSHGVKTYQLVVREARPANTVCIIDTDLTVDVIEPIEPVTYNETLEFGSAVDGSVAADAYAYYALLIPDPQAKFVVAVDAAEGDPDVYLSSDPANKRPTREICTWYGERLGANRVVFDGSDDQWRGGLLYIGVRGYNGPATFTLRVTGVDENEPGRTAADDTLSEGVVCDNCRKHVPAAALATHEARCSRTNFRCPQCSLVMHVSERAKHEAVAHTPLLCPCGQRFEQGQIQVHRRFDCELRLVQCLYCELYISFNTRGVHQQQCGTATTACRLCTLILRKNELKRHVAEQHGCGADVDPCHGNYGTRDEDAMEVA